MNDVKSFFDERAEGWNACQKSTKAELKAFLSKYTPFEKGMRILDVACGTGVISGILYELTQTPVVAVDISTEMIKVAKRTHTEPIEFVEGDFLMLEEGTFDGVICFNAYPHFLVPEAFAEKASRIIRKGGYLVVTHNFARRLLNSHHEAHAAHVSRMLGCVEEEVKVFSDFEPVLLKDDEEAFAMVLKRK